MKITVYAKYELEFFDNEIKDMKKAYDGNPDGHYDMSNKDEFIEVITDELCENYDFDVIVNDNEGYSDFCQKWNEM